MVHFFQLTVLICLYVVEKKEEGEKEGRKEWGELIIFLYRELYLLIVSNQSLKTRISAFITNKAIKVISQT